MKAFVLIVICSSLLTSCLKQAQPLDRIPETLVWKDSALIDAYTVDVYSEMTFLMNLGVQASDAYSEFSGNFYSTLTDEAHTAFTWLWLYYYFKNGKGSPNDFANYAGNTPFDVWKLYSTIRKMNVFLKDIQTSTLPPSSIKIREARMRWARAFAYFILARNYGGVPLIVAPQSADDPKDSLYPKRNKEIEVYDFALSELDAVIGGNELPAKKYDNGNPTLYAALALKSKIALYAANLAKWGSIDLGGTLGVPADRATGLYQASYDASRKIIDDGVFTLFNQLPGNKSENFRQLFLTRQNSEVIYAKELNGPVKGVGSNYDVWEFPFGVQGGWPGNATQPYLELAEEFEVTNGTPGEPAPLDRTAIQQGLWTYDQLWANRDPRFFATLYTHGSTFQAKTLQMNQDTRDAGGNIVQTAGVNYSGGMNTGFGVLKYCDDALIKPNANDTKTDAIVFRLGGVLLDNAEAAFELSKTGDALDDINKVRDRAGVPLLGSVTRDNIRHERKVELAFENGERYYSLKSWRLSEPLLSKQYSGLQFTADVVSGKFSITVLPNIDGANPPLFRKKDYYIPLGIVITTNNTNLVENPNY